MFIEELHLYLDDKGNPIPSVTQIISAVCGDDFQYVDKEVLAKACERGTKVHTITEMLDKGLTPIIDEEVAPYILAYQSLELPEWKDIEKSFFCATKYPYCGCADRITEDGVYDIKTSSSINKLKCSLQLTAYAIGLNTGIDLYAIHLTKDGKAKVIKLDFMAKEWLAILCVYYLVHFPKWKAEMQEKLRDLQLEELV